jgi:hypothetical protein
LKSNTIHKKWKNIKKVVNPKTAKPATPIIPPQKKLAWANFVHYAGGFYSFWQVPKKRQQLKV